MAKGEQLISAPGNSDASLGSNRMPDGKNTQLGEPDHREGLSETEWVMSPGPTAAKCRRRIRGAVEGAEPLREKEVERT